MAPALPGHLRFPLGCKSTNRGLTLSYFAIKEGATRSKPRHFVKPLLAIQPSSAQIKEHAQTRSDSRH
jgi:hypothetical protein